ncbi:hypothetical protein ES703_44483 [subsurface metagenome]
MKVENKEMLDPTGIGIKKVLIVTLTVLALGQAVWAQQAGDSPLKIFILAGQSNMEGQGEMTSGAQGNLTYLVENDTEGTFQHLVDAGGDWVVRDDVWIWYKRGGTTVVKGGLSAGYGVNSHCIGPELQFGHVMGESYGNQVLLIKTAWGGKSLAVDFRPPSSGYDKVPVAVGDQGYYYMEMMAIVADVLANLSTHFPAYDGQGYEIAGFGWHQGWNDRVNQTFNDEYEQNMANFIRDVRKDLGIPNLPFVIATTGMSGWDETHPRALSLMAAQLAMANATTYPEFVGNVAVVETRDFWRTAAESPANQAYHWNRNAETYFLIGSAMGEEMIYLLAPMTISGNAGLAGVVMSGLPGNPVSSEGGIYSGFVQEGWSGTVTPTLAGYLFTPPSITYTDVTTVQLNQDYTAHSLIGDINLDGKITLVDYSQLASWWLETGCEESNNFCDGADIDQMSDVGLDDLLILAENWLAGVIVEPPGQASNPHPADGATDVSKTADLSWTAGSRAPSHDVYFGTTNPPPFIGNQTATIFDPGTMTISTTYYWRIDEVGPYGGTTTGTVWSFTTELGPPPL